MVMRVIHVHVGCHEGHGLSDLWSCESSVVIMVMCGHEGEGYDIC